MVDPEVLGIIHSIHSVLEVNINGDSRIETELSYLFTNSSELSFSSTVVVNYPFASILSWQMLGVE